MYPRKEPFPIQGMSFLQTETRVFFFLPSSLWQSETRVEPLSSLLSAKLAHRLAQAGGSCGILVRSQINISHPASAEVEK